MTILIFKIFWLAALTVFVIFISDHRKKSPSTRPLINRKLILLTKCCYPVPIVACAYAVATAEQIGLADWIALSVTISGCVLTIGAKIQLGGGHTWAGYYTPGGLRVHTGLYRYMSHPMYTGIIGVIIAGTVFFARRLPCSITVIAMVINAWIITFLIIVARRETRVKPSA